eukprot:3314445-Rhodomonas_salina.1
MKELTKAILELLRDVTQGPEQQLLRSQIKELDLETDLAPDDEETVKGAKDFGITTSPGLLVDRCPSTPRSSC